MEGLSHFEKHLSMHSYFQATPVSFSVRVTLSNSDVEACKHENFSKYMVTHSTISKERLREALPILEKQSPMEGWDEPDEIEDKLLDGDTGDDDNDISESEEYS